MADDGNNHWQGSPALTFAEHKARAMLLGLEYDWKDGTYCRVNLQEGEEPDPNDGFDMYMIDCVTLERVFIRESQWRAITYRNKPKPWERRDESQDSQDHSTA